MSDTYFARLKEETPTRVWVNNPTLDEIDLALAQGAVGCTTNPAYGGGLLRRAPDEVRPLIDESIAATDADEEAADLVQRRLVARVAERFRPMYESSGGRAGFVSIQGAPEADTDAGHILDEGRTGRQQGPNVTPKIPATLPGLAAFETLVAEGSPTIVTEVFSLAQLIETSERYLRVTSRTGHRPPFFMSPITGIFGDHLKALAARDGLDVPKTEMELAGVAVSRACHRVVEERGYPVTLLCGGARVPFDLTGLVGARVHVTINWSTFAEVIASDEPFRRGYDEPIDQAAIHRLATTFDDVRRALDPAALAPGEFEGFGPVRFFRDNFIAGWNGVRAAVREARSAAAGVAR